MKFIILKENLKRGLSMVAHLSNKNINLPILNNILIRVQKNGVELLSTNLEINIKHFIRAKVEKEGEFTVDSKIINEYINLLPDDKIEIELMNEDLSVKCQNHKTKIKGQSSNDFPILSDIKKENTFSLSVNNLKTALSSVVFSVSNNENRIELSGVLFDFKDGVLSLAGTDSYRLSEKKISYKNCSGEIGRVIVPVRTIQELIRVLNNFKLEEQLETEDEIEVFLSEGQISFSFGTTNITSRIISGNYPDYSQIIPEKEKTIVNINKSNLVRAIKAAGLFSKTGINDVILKTEKDKLKISSSSSQAGENFIDIDCVTKGEDNEITINYKYFLEGLNNISSDNIIIKITDNNTPCILLSEKKDDTFLYLVMPLKV